MRRALGLAWALMACARGPVSPIAGPPSSAPPAPLPAPVSATPPPFDALPSLDALRARAPLLAPGMRSVASGELSSLSPPASAAPLLVRADDGDTCVRVVLVAQPELHAWITDGRDDILSDISSATDTSIAPRGPVCVRKGDTVTLHLAGEGPWAARFAAWASSGAPAAPK
jgi:hypothetical protein